MNKYLLFILTIIISTSVVIADDAKFTRALTNCSPYNEQGNINTDGMLVKSGKKILGWNDNKCVYKESVDILGMNIDIVCRFNKAQIKELTSVMNAYSLIQNYSDENIDTLQSSALMGNPVIKVWTKYLNDSSVCNISGLE